MLTPKWAPAALLLALVTTLDRPSEACSPPQSGLSSSIPASGSTYPANAAVFLMGYNMALDDVVVTVDGAAASLVPADAIGPLGLGSFAVLVTPAPQPGQAVEIKGTFCLPIDQCPAASISFVASEPDTSAPAALSDLSFNVHDYPDFKSSGGDCQSDSDLAFWIHGSVEPPAMSESPVLVTFEAFRDQELKNLAFSRSTFATSADITIGHRATLDFLAGASAPDALCFRASTIDAAGNKGATSAAVCKPCNYRQDSSPSMSNWPPDEPMWTQADAYPGGPCFMGSGAGGGGSSSSSSGSGGDDKIVINDGCSIRAEGPSTNAGSSDARSALAALAVIALIGAFRKRSPSSRA